MNDRLLNLVPYIHTHYSGWKAERLTYISVIRLNAYLSIIH